MEDELKADTEFSKRFEIKADRVVGDYLENHFKEGRPLAVLVKRYVEEQMRLELVSVRDEEFERDALSEQEEEEDRDK